MTAPDVPSTNAPDILESLPASVKAIAPMAVGGKEMKQRLLTDPTMKVVWDYLMNAKVEQKGIDTLHPHERLKFYGIEESVSLSEQACAGLFIHAAMQFSNPHTPIAWTMAQAGKMAEPFFSAAKLCQWIMSDPMFAGDREFVAAASIMMPNLERYGRRLKEQGRLVEFGQHDSPFILKRGSWQKSKSEEAIMRDQKIRGQVRELAYFVRRLFGSSSYWDRPVAIIVTVALDLKPPVPTKTVADWCRNLPLEPAPVTASNKQGGLVRISKINLRERRWAQ
jgi:hypothetical protein